MVDVYHIFDQTILVISGQLTRVMVGSKMLNTDVVFDKSEQSTMFHSFKFQMITYVQDDFPHLSGVKTA